MHQPVPPPTSIGGQGNWWILRNGPQISHRDTQKTRACIKELPFAYLVGGSVRDALLGNPPKDLDIEVYQTSLDDLVKTLEKAGKVDQVGKSFGVIKLTLDGQIFDFS